MKINSIVISLLFMYAPIPIYAMDDVDVSAIGLLRMAHQSIGKEVSSISSTKTVLNKSIASLRSTSVIQRDDAVDLSDDTFGSYAEIDTGMELDSDKFDPFSLLTIAHELNVTTPDLNTLRIAAQKQDKTIIWHKSKDKRGAEEYTLALKPYSQDIQSAVQKRPVPSLMVGQVTEQKDVVSKIPIIRIHADNSQNSSIICTAINVQPYEIFINGMVYTYYPEGYCHKDLALLYPEIKETIMLYDPATEYFNTYGLSHNGTYISIPTQTDYAHLVGSRIDLRKWHKPIGKKYALLEQELNKKDAEFKQNPSDDLWINFDTARKDVAFERKRVEAIALIKTRAYGYGIVTQDMTTEQIMAALRKRDKSF